MTGAATSGPGPVPQSETAEAPETGVPAVDDALRSLADLTGLPVGEHQARLARAHSVLHGVLDRDAADPG